MEKSKDEDGEREELLREIGSWLFAGLLLLIITLMEKFTFY